MDPTSKIFSDLESNQTHECDEAKKKLVECFTQNKEQWVVQYMMDYYCKTGSMRIIEVLVKVQAPHDLFIFDRLTELLKGTTNRMHALNFFSFVVRKHPTWLYKVEKHRLIKDIFKLLLTEKDIVPLMTALLCIITLLPIIPSLVPHILNDLFDVFGHLASWNSQNPNRLTDDKLVHLQLGLQMLFHRLYGMYPCSFLAYLSEFTKKEKGAIFHHTIKPLLGTVRVHPMLVTANTETEVSISRWKEKEPHDVVEECAKLSLPAMYQDLNAEHKYELVSSEYRHTPIGAHSTSTSTYSYHLKDQPVYLQSTSHQQHHRLASRFDCGGSNLSSTIWSPNNEIPSSGPMPLTPTPSYMLPATPSNINNLLCVTGSSPPEAAVEATPETTPLKDMRELKQGSAAMTGLVNPHAVRAIFPSSQPSSPMRKEASQFNYPETATTVLEQEHTTRLVTRVTTIDRRLQQVIQDRTRSQSPFQTIETLAAKQEFRSPIDLKCESPEVDSDSTCSHVMNSTPTPAPTPVPTTPTPTPIEPITKICDNCNETEGSMCTAGGLQIPTSRSMQLLVKDIKRRNRMTSYCYNDSSCEKINANKKDATTVTEAAKVRRTKSCPSICFASASSKLADSDEDSDVATRPSAGRLQKSGKMLAIATAKKNIASSVSAGTSARANVASQTVDVVPHSYENSLIQMLLESADFRNAHERNLLYPHEILDQYISRTIKVKDNVVDLEHYQLLCLQLQYERYRREIHAERNRRLMGRSRDKHTLEMERDCLREQLMNFAAKNNELLLQNEKTMKAANEREQMYQEELMELKAKLQNEAEQNKCLRQANDNLQTRLTEELAHRKDVNYELESLRGQIFNLNTELQHVQIQAEMGQQFKQELARLEAEFIVMGEVQIKCRDRIAELDNYKARDEEMKMLQENYNMEMRDLRHVMEEKTSQLDSARHKIVELQAQIVNNEKVVTEQKRLLKTVKDEYEEKFKALNKKYDVQKIIIMQMEEKIVMSLHKPQAGNACSPDTDRTDIASSMDRNSPLSTSLASSESLSASLRSTELRNLQQLVETTPTFVPEAAAPLMGSSSISVVGGNIIDGQRMPVLDLAASANTAGGLATASTSAAAAVAVTHNYDNMGATISSHIHPHMHLQQHQQKQKPHKR